MVNVVTRNTVAAAVVETTEGTLKAPSAASEYFKLQAGFQVAHNFDQLENAELTSTIANSAPTLGFENPSFTMSHYFRGSGVVGTPPDYAPFLKALLGTETTQATERDTIAGSTVSVVNVDTGEGDEFPRGQPILVKHATNAWEIRPAESEDTTDEITLGFDLDNAPGTSVSLGRGTLWAPADTGHQSLSIWCFNGDGGSTEAVAGSRVSAMTITCQAGQMVNAQYTMDGIESYYNPLIATASLRYIDFTDDDGTFAAAVEAKAYKTPHDLAIAIAAAMNATATTETHTVTYIDSTGKFTFSATGAVFSLLWNTGTNAANTIGTLIGFSVAADDTGATEYTGDNAIDYTAQQTPSYDSAEPVVAKNLQLLLGDSDDITCAGISQATINVNTPNAKVDDLCAASGRSGSTVVSRSGSVTITKLMSKNEADTFQRYQKNTTTRLFLVVGSKSGGNWEPAKNMTVYMPLCKVTGFQSTDLDGLMRIEMTLSTFHDGGDEGEMFIGHV